jgi:enoyl-CoA hydratase
MSFRVGKSKTMDAFLGAAEYSAEEAADLGIVNRVYPVEDLVDEAMKIAQAIAKLDMKDIIFIKDLTKHIF